MWWFVSPHTFTFLKLNALHQPEMQQQDSRKSPKKLLLFLLKTSFLEITSPDIGEWLHPRNVRLPKRWKRLIATWRRHGDVALRMMILGKEVVQPWVCQMCGYQYHPWIFFPHVYTSSTQFGLCFSAWLLRNLEMWRVILGVNREECGPHGI